MPAYSAVMAEGQPTEVSMPGRMDSAMPSSGDEVKYKCCISGLHEFMHSFGASKVSKNSSTHFLEGLWGWVFHLWKDVTDHICQLENYVVHNF